jgi:hypothetical protein
VFTFRIYDPESEKFSLNSFHFPVVAVRGVVTFRMAITGKCSLSGCCCPEGDHFPDGSGRKVKNVRTLFYLQINNVSMENQDIIILVSLSGCCCPEGDHFPDGNNRKVITFRIYDPESDTKKTHFR